MEGIRYGLKAKVVLQKQGSIYTPLIGAYDICALRNRGEFLRKVNHWFRDIETTLGMELKIRVGSKEPVRVMIMNQFRFFEKQSHKLSPENEIASNDRRIDHIVRKI